MPNSAMRERLCTKTSIGSGQKCLKMLFHEGKHEDLEGNAWYQDTHILLTRINSNGTVMHLDLFRDRQQAMAAASDDLVTGEAIEWNVLEAVSGEFGIVKEQRRYLTTVVDLTQIQQGLETAVTHSRSLLGLTATGTRRWKV